MDEEKAHVVGRDLNARQQTHTSWVGQSIDADGDLGSKTHARTHDVHICSQSLVEPTTKRYSMA